MSFLSPGITPRMKLMKELSSDSPDLLNRQNVLKASDIGIPKFSIDSIDKSTKFFAENGYVIYKNVYDSSVIHKTYDYLNRSMQSLHKYAQAHDLTPDIFGFADASIQSLANQSFYQGLEVTSSLLKILQPYLGPNIAKIGWDALWWNQPAETSTVLVKNVHADVWTGTSVNTVFWKVLLTDVQFSNALGVCPSSHLLGLLPVKNRSVDYDLSELNLEYISLDNLEAGDAVLWHPLLLHFTVGCGTMVRASITMRYTSMDTPFSSQEKSLGYKVLSSSPLNYVMRVVGTDYASPFRVMGGARRIDRRISSIYPCAPTPINERTDESAFDGWYNALNDFRHE